MTFSEKLLSLRRRRGLSQDQLAELLGVSRQSVSKWESQQTLPEPGKLILISEIFGVSLDRLLKEDLTLEDAEPAPEEHTESEAPLLARADVHLDTVFCTQCGRENSADSVFCGYCGAPFPDAPASEQEVHDYDEYWGLSYFDIESGKKIELFPSGVRVSHDKGLPKYQFSQIIPYSSILEVRSVRASAVSSGYISIITATGGITEDVPRMQLLKDHNTVLFTRKTEPEVERIYRAIEDICDGSAFPSDTVEAAGRGTSSDGAVKYTPSLANAPKPKKKRGCLVPALVTCLLFIAFMVYVRKNVNPTGSNKKNKEYIK